MAKDRDIVWMSALELAQSIKKGEISPVEVLEIFLKRIRAVDAKINAFVTLAEESARKEDQPATGPGNLAAAGGTAVH